MVEEQCLNIVKVAVSDVGAIRTWHMTVLPEQTLMDRYCPQKIPSVRRRSRMALALDIAQQVEEQGLDSQKAPVTNAGATHTWHMTVMPAQTLMGNTCSWMAHKFLLSCEAVSSSRRPRKISGLGTK